VQVIHAQAGGAVTLGARSETMKFTEQALLNAPIDQVDLEQWMFSLSDAEYQQAARAHRAAGAFVDNGVRGTVNVESMGGTLIIQHYREVQAEPSYVELFSERSQAYLFHLVPVTAQVRWTVQAAARDATSSIFTCTVEVTLPPVVRVLARMLMWNHFIGRHADEETHGFAADINRKLAARRSMPHR
jgi:hypothetical protein